MSTAEAPELVSKSQFAQIIGVSAGRVSQYISGGKIHGAAIEGVGRNAKIRVPVARAQLRSSLDSGQMLGNGLDTRLGGGSQDQFDGPISSGGDPLNEQIKVERLKEARAKNRKLEEEERARAGRYTETTAVEGALRSVAARVLNAMEGGLAQMATEVAASLNVPQRDVLHLLRQEMRKIRSSAENEARRAAAGLAQTVDVGDDVDDQDAG